MIQYLWLRLPRISEMHSVWMHFIYIVANGSTPPPQSYGSSEREDSAEREKAKVLNFPSNSLIKCLIQISFRLES